ncbi:MAG TPA: hypothetical protein VFU19_14955 [Iamia sp.]|nr:hypothetical protein [Iamia sp.]
MGLSACGDGSDPVSTGAGAEAAPTTPAPAPAPTEPAPSTEPAPPGGDSPVDGLSAAQLRTVVEAPPSGTAARRRTGPVADRVTVDGRTVWRITIPGTYDLLSSRITVTVGGTDVGEGIIAPDLTALVAVVADPAVLVAGAPVAYRWGAGDPVAAGRLEVAR